MGIERGGRKLSKGNTNCKNCNVELFWEDKEICPNCNTSLQIPNTICKCDECFASTICKVCDKPLMTIDGKEKGEHWWHDDPSIIESEDGHEHDFSHIEEGSVGHCKLCSVSISPLQIAKDNSNDEYEQLPLKLKIANHLLIATELIEKSENTDTQKIRWLENIANVLKGIENEWELTN